MRLMMAVLLGGSLCAAAAEGADLKAGAAAVDITPKVGTPMAGYYFERASEGVHDPLFAKALVLESGGRRVALVSLDLISTTRGLVEKSREAIEKRTGLKGADVMISATHAHTGPVLTYGGPREEKLGGKNALTEQYNEELPSKIADAVEKAEKALTPTTLSAAHGRETSIAFNRRFHMTDGTVGWNPGKLNPKILKPAGAIDPDVAVLYFESPDVKKSPIATYINYAVHLDNVGGTKFSADMPATIADLMGRFKGPDMVTVYTSGCCGDINHIDVQWATPQGGNENAARMGTILAGEVFKTWPKLKAIDAGALRVRSKMVPLPLAKIEPGEVEKARATIDRMGDKEKPPAFLELVKAFQVLDVAARGGRPLDVEVQVIALGDSVAWVSLPGEIFVELGLEIKQDSPFAHTVIAELANGIIGYIPSRRAYAQGNYEVVSARCAEGSGEMLVDAAVTMLRDLHREALGTHPDVGK